MNPLQLLAYFLLAAAPIVLVTTCIAHADDASALRRYPGRLLTFVVACLAVVALMLLAQRIFLP